MPAGRRAAILPRPAQRRERPGEPVVASGLALGAGQDEVILCAGEGYICQPLALGTLHARLLGERDAIGRRLHPLDAVTQLQCHAVAAPRQPCAARSSSTTVT